MAVDQKSQETLFDTLYCEDEKWVELEDNDEQEDNDYDGSEIIILNKNRNSSSPPPILEQDLFWDNEELQSLFSKERESANYCTFNYNDSFLSQHHSLARKEAVEWILKINSHYGFSALTAILAVNYADRFMSSVNFPQHCQDDVSGNKPWMMQLVAVTCLSLAAKVEETYVPLLLDLQVVEGGARYVFEAKTVQRMELLVLSTLKWRMNPLTPLSFIDHTVRRLGLRDRNTHWEFLRSCEDLLLSVISDSRFVCYLPSVMATATMLHVLHQLVVAADQPSSCCNDTVAMDYEKQLLGVLKISKEYLDGCYNLISEKLSNTARKTSTGLLLSLHNNKRTFCQVTNNSSSPISGVLMDSYDQLISSDMDESSSNDSWEFVGSCISSSSSSSHGSLFKKRRVQEQPMKLPCRSVFVDVITSPH